MNDQASQNQVSPPIISNFKIRTKITDKGRPSLLEGIHLLKHDKNRCMFPLKKGKKKKPFYSKYNNFVVIRADYIFTVFIPHGSINITGIPGPNFSNITEALNSFCRIVNINSDDILKPIIDNISASGRYNNEIDLKRLKEELNSSERNPLFKSSSFNRSVFPAAFCKTNGIGTISVFRNGKYNIIGAKCQDDITKLYSKLIAAIATLSTPTKKERPSVVIVA